MTNTKGLYESIRESQLKIDHNIYVGYRETADQLAAQSKSLAVTCATLSTQQTIIEYYKLIVSNYELISRIEASLSYIKDDYDDEACTLNCRSKEQSTEIEALKDIVNSANNLMCELIRIQINCNSNISDYKQIIKQLES